MFTQNSDMLNKNTYRVQKAWPISSSYLTIAIYIATCDENYDISKGQELAIAIGREYKCDWI